MHNLCTEANNPKFSGANVEKDFVELPSQMLENWMWDKTIMKRVSKHYKTGESLPEDKLVQMEKLRLAYSGLDTMR
jgi:Zn-dependent oligopeptidase